MTQFNDVSDNTKSAMWEHYYANKESRRPEHNRKIRRVTKKEIIVRTLKKNAPKGETVSLQELSELTGLSSHDLSGHLTHLVHEGKVERRGRGLFAVCGPSAEGRDSKIELRKLIDQMTGTSKGRQIEEKIVINNKDHSESRRILLDYLNDMLLACSEVDLNIKCVRDQNKSGGKVIIELRAQ